MAKKVETEETVEVKEVSDKTIAPVDISGFGMQTLTSKTSDSGEVTGVVRVHQEDVINTFKTAGITKAQVETVFDTIHGITAGAYNFAKSKIVAGEADNFQVRIPIRSGVTLTHKLRGSKQVPDGQPGKAVGKKTIYGTVNNIMEIDTPKEFKELYSDGEKEIEKAITLKSKKASKAA